ncbi:MAG: NAD(P)/FAD-dependent oxidoreductase [Candidatus Eiseniibacteriota bacterium]
MARSADAVIVGGGVMGCSIALHLREAGVSRVTVLERDNTYARASSYLAMGGIRQQFGSALNVKLVQLSLPFWRTLDERMSRPEQQVRANFRPRGYLFLANGDQAEAFERRVKLMTSCGAAVEKLDRAEISRRLPDAFLGDISFGVFGRDDGYASPREVLKGMRAGAEISGAEFVAGEVTAIERTGDRAAGVKLTNGERISAGVVVNAAGAWAGELARLAGCDLPIRPQRQHLFRCALPDFWPYRFPMVIDPTGVHWRHDDPDHISDLDRIVVARTDTDEPFGENFECDASRWERDFLPALIRRMPAFKALRVIEAWCGLYEVTPDHNPVIGAQPGIEGFFVAAGFSGHGLMMSPAIGRVMSEIIRTGRAESADVSPLGADRFARGEVFLDGAMI